MLQYALAPFTSMIECSGDVPSKYGWNIQLIKQNHDRLTTSQAPRATSSQRSAKRPRPSLARPPTRPAMKPSTQPVNQIVAHTQAPALNNPAVSHLAGYITNITSVCMHLRLVGHAPHRHIVTSIRPTTNIFEHIASSTTSGAYRYEAQVVSNPSQEGLAFLVTSGEMAGGACVHVANKTNRIRHRIRVLLHAEKRRS